MQANPSWIQIHLARHSQMIVLSSLMVIGLLPPSKADTLSDSRAGHPTAVNPFHPTTTPKHSGPTGHAPSSVGRQTDPFYDDDDEDDLDDLSGALVNPSFPTHNPNNPTTHTNPYTTPGQHTPPSTRGEYENQDYSNQNINHSRRTFSAGGAQDNTPEPVHTAKGIAVGGGMANGIITKGKVAPLKIDSETAEGSDDIVTDFNFPDADVLTIAKTLGKLTGKNFVYDDKEVKGKVSIISNSPITVSAAWKAFLTALDMNGFALIPSGKYLRISKQRDARDKQLKTYTGDFSPDTDALITRVFSLKYISSDEVARTFRSFMPANSRIIPYDQTNTVIVTDTGSNIAKLAKMLEILDVEGFDAGIEVIPVKYASAAELSKLIDTLVPGTSTPAPGSPPGGPRFTGGSGGKFNARRTKEGGIINTIVADERTNTLIVHANSRGADQVRELVAKLDQRPTSSSSSGRVHVVYLQFADAEQLANTLNNFSSNAGAARPPGSGAPGNFTGTGVNPNSTTLFESAIKISPDKSTNALVITASASDFVTVKRVINRLDIPRDQVYVEVVIMEVQISRGFDYSANIISAPSMIGSLPSNDLMSFITNPLGSTGGLIGFPLGAQTTINVPNGQPVTVSSVMGLIKLIQSTTNSNILATPQIIALDNAEATFESSEKIPIQTSTLVQGVGSQLSITKEPVILSIKIKPQINKIANFVKLDVTAKHGDLGNNVPTALVGQAFSTLDRTAQTSVVVGDADTIVLGGLIRDKISDTVSKIPILGDLPLLGWLFKAKKSKAEKSNLLIFMTPHIVRQYDKVRQILDKKLKERDDFIETAAGGEDGLRYQRDAIIRSLPNIQELSKTHPDTSTVGIEEDSPTTARVLPPSAEPAQLNPEGRVNPTGGSIQPGPSIPIPPEAAPITPTPANP